MRYTGVIDHLGYYVALKVVIRVISADLAALDEGTEIFAQFSTSCSSSLLHSF